MSFLGGSEPQFDPADAFVPEHIPEPGAFLAGHDVLGGRDHVALHRTAADAFEEYGVYDATFGYNLARLNRDPRHTDAGFRYAEEADDPTTRRAEFTPTTAFCPQAEPLAVGAFRALDAVDTHGYELVRVRVDASLDGSDARSTPPEEASESERPIRSQSGIAAAHALRSVDSVLTARSGSNMFWRNDHSGAARTDGSMTATDTVLDVRDRDDPPFPIISDALDDLAPPTSPSFVNSFEPEPLYDVLADRGFDHETERASTTTSGTSR